MTDAPINVGWGSKQTQFHGSLGKAAAQAPVASSLPSVGVSPDDDLLTRISWRGDGALFVVSAVSPAPADATSLRRRMLRVYNRDGMFSQAEGRGARGDMMLYSSRRMDLDMESLVCDTGRLMLGRPTQRRENGATR